MATSLAHAPDLGLVLLAAPLVAPTAEAALTQNRFTLANSCFALQHGGSFVAKAGDGYRVSAPTASGSATGPK